MRECSVLFFGAKCGFVSMSKMIVVALLLVLGWNSMASAQMKGKKKTTKSDEKADVEGKDEELLLTPKWHVAFLNQRPLPGTIPLPEQTPFKVLDDLEFTGPFENDPFLLGRVKVDGQWALIDGFLARSAGRNAAIKVAKADQFELEGKINAEGLGGWFMLLGWADGNGYAIYNVNLKTSGSPWHICEFRGGEGIESTHQETSRYECRGVESFRLRVNDDQVSMKIETTMILENYPMRNYNLGDVIIGTYDTKYGAKTLKIQSLRLRAIEEK